MTGRDKLVVVALIGLLAVTSIAAIVADSEPVATTPAIGGTYVEGVAGTPRFLDPLIAATNVDQDVSRLVFTGLTRRDRAGAIQPDLASVWRTDVNGKVWTFDIRADAAWHDGAPVTADDVIYTVGLVQDKAYVGPYADAFRGVTVERVAQRSVRFTLTDLYAPFADSTTMPLLPSHLLGGVTYAQLARQTFNARPVGTGPFKVTDVDSRARQIVLTFNGDFYRTKPARSRPYLDKIVLRFYGDSSEALEALARGEIDGVGGLNTIDAERSRTLKNVSLFSMPTNDFTAIFLNLRPDKTIFRDRVVRQAIATAIDRGRVLQVAADGRGSVADEFVPSSSWAYVKDLKRYQYSAAEARAMLDDADWKDHDGDGIRDKGGQALRFTLATSDESARVTAGAQIASDLRAVGIRVDLQTLPFGELVDKVARLRTFDALLVGISLSGDPDPYDFFHSSQVKDPGHNFAGYSTLPIDRNLEAARKTFDQAKRLDLYTPVFQAIATEVPVIFLYYTDYLYALNRSVNGIRVTAIDDPTQRFWNIEDWYVKTASRR